MADYFVANPTYDAMQFCHCFRMRRELFDTILADVLEHDSYFGLIRFYCESMRRVKLLGFVLSYEV